MVTRLSASDFYEKRSIRYVFRTLDAHSSNVPGPDSGYFVRSFASGFIFATALPPAMAAGALASIRHLKDGSDERARHQNRVASVRRRLDDVGIPHLENPSHIVPIMVRDPVLCKQISDRLMDEFAIYVQPINYPTVARGSERLRLTPSPLHTDADTDQLIAALSAIWSELSPGAPRSGGGAWI